MKSTRKITNRLSAIDKLVDLNLLANLSHQHINHAVESAHENNSSLEMIPRPVKKYKSNSSTIYFYYHSPYTRLAKLIEEHKEYAMYVLAELLNVDFNTIFYHPDVIKAVQIFVNFKLYGKDYRSENGNGNTCLHDALGCGLLRKDLTVLLVQQGADINQENDNHLTALTMLIEEDFDHLYPLTLQAADKSFLEKIIRVFAYVTKKHPKHFSRILNACKWYDLFNQYPELFNMYSINDNYQDYMLHLAAGKGVLNIVNLLLQQGANPDLLNVDQCKPIHYAVTGIMYDKDIDSDSFKDKINIIAVLLMKSLYRSREQLLKAEDIVYELLTLDLKSDYRKKVCKAIFYYDYEMRCSFSEAKLLLQLQSGINTMFHHETTIYHEINEGTFGCVYKGSLAYQKRQYPVAIKMTKHPGHPGMRQEAEIHSNLSHPNIIQFIGALERNNKFGIVMDYADEGTLNDFIFDQKKEVLQECIYPYSKQIISALNYLHSLDYVNLDLKPANILLKNLQGLARFAQLLLADFGSCAKSGETRSFDVTTYEYCAPERFDNRNPFKSKNDIYSFAIILGNMDTQEDAWPLGTSGHIMKQMVCQGARPEFNYVKRSYFVEQLMFWCWEQDPDKRPDCNQIDGYLDQYLGESYQQSPTFL